MSDTKAISNLLEASQRARFDLEQTVEDLRSSLARSQSDANRARAGARDFAARIDRIGEGLTALLTAAVQASEDNPGDRGLAARVRQARASLDVYTAATGGQK